VPEILEDDPIAIAITRFRAEAPSEILPPGTAAARKTVRRRRTTRLAGTAAAAVIGLVGAGLAVASLRTGPSIDPAGPVDFGPTLAPQELTRLSLEALAALGYEPTDERPDLDLVRPGIVFGEAGPAGFEYHLGTEDEPLPPGTYQLQGVCRGRGTVELGWEAPGGATGSSTLVCNGYGNAESVIVAGLGGIALTITADDEAAGRAGVAVVITDPRIVAARNAIAYESGAPVSGGEGVLTAPITNVDERRADLATYRLDAACAGVGTVTVTLQIGAAAASDAISCSTAGTTASVSVDAPSRGDAITVTFEPDPTATGHAAVAYRIDKL
jgi:hypothetical protein